MSYRLDPRWRPFDNDPALPPLTIGVLEYQCLPEPIRREFDAWLYEVGLTRGVFQVGLREGYVEVGRYATGPDGKFWLIDHAAGWVAEEWFCLPTRILPPQEVFRAAM